MRQMGRPGVDKRTFLVGIVLALLCVAVFHFQPDDVLFGPGHFGWVSSHTLAIIRNATPDRWFLGFTCEFTGHNNYAYFDRYPILFSGSMHLLLEPFKSSSADYISWARACMNLIYVLSIFVGYRIAFIFTNERITALFAAMFTFMGVFFVFYKDMVHFDQPAVLGILVLFYTISRYELYGETRWLWISLAAVLLGRGYASNFLLLLWNIIFAAGLVVNRRFSVHAYFTSVPFKACLAAGLISISALCFNVLSEARVTNVPWQDTSIVTSALARLGLDADSEPKSSEKTRLPYFTKEQVKRTIGGFVPYALYPYHGTDSSDPPWLLLSVYFLILSALLSFSLTRTDLLRRWRNRPTLVLLALLNGFFWLYPMRNLAAFHNYTHMYHVLLYLLLFSAVFYSLRDRQTILFPLIVASMLFLGSLYAARDVRSVYNLPGNDINAEVDRIRAYLYANDISRVHLAGGYRHFVEGSPYASCFYFSDFQLAHTRQGASTLISRTPLTGRDPAFRSRRLYVYEVY